MTPILLLAISLIQVVLAPLIAGFARRSGVLFAGTDSFVATTIGALTLVHILPHAYSVVGPVAWVAALLGGLVPIGMHMAFHRLEHRAMPFLLWLVLGALALHAMLDGAALAASSEAASHGAMEAAHGHEHATNGSLLGAAVVLHRFPMVLGIWWFALPRLGRWAASGLLAAIGIGTVVGYSAVGLSWAALDSRPLALIQAVVGGMLFHVLIGHEGPEHDRTALGKRRRAIVAGTLLGIALMVVMAALGTLELPAASPLSTVITIGASLAVAAYVLQARWRQRHEHRH